MLVREESGILISIFVVFMCDAISYICFADQVEIIKAIETVASGCMT